MSTANSLPGKKDYAILIPFVSALLIVLFLSFIDEGYYSFSWVKDPSSWPAFGIYLAIFFIIQAIIYNFALNFLKGAKRNIVMLGVVTPLIFALIVWMGF